MFLCLQRHHYDKALLVWLSMCAYWGINNTALFEMFRSHLLIFDEYPVENAHSITRSKTNPQDSVESLRKKAKVAFESKHITQINFQEHFSRHLRFCSHKISSSTLTQKVQRLLHRYSKASLLPPQRQYLPAAANPKKYYFPGYLERNPRKEKYFHWDTKAWSNLQKKIDVTYQNVEWWGTSSGHC